jgi:hypothetical protein
VSRATFSRYLNHWVYKVYSELLEDWGNALNFVYLAETMPIPMVFPFTAQGKEQSILTESINPKRCNKIQDQLLQALLRKSQIEFHYDD